MTARRGDQRGQGIVEFSLLLPVIILLMLGTIDLGRAVYAYNTVANAARVGARVAAVNQIYTTPLFDCDQSYPIENPLLPHWSIGTCAANSAISLGIRATDVAVTYGPPPSLPGLACPARPSAASPLHIGCLVNVTVHYTWSPLTPIVSSIWPSIRMDQTSQVSVERVFP